MASFSIMLGGLSESELGTEAKQRAGVGKNK